MCNILLHGLNRNSSSFISLLHHVTLTVLLADFILSYREQSGPWRELTIPRTSDQRYTLSGLREGTSYELKLLAEGEGSTSEASETMTVLTEGSLSDAIFPRGSAGGQGDLPVYLRWTILAPTLASLGIITIVSLIACCLVSRERKKYKNMVGQYLPKDVHKEQFPMSAFVLNHLF